MSTTSEKGAKKDLATEKLYAHNEIFTAKKEFVDAYEHKPIEGIAERRASPIYHVRTIANWIKSCLIKSYAHPSSRVLDLGCGHGGDLGKYAACNIGFYVGVDISPESLKEVIRRYNTLNDIHFPAKFICADISTHSINSPAALEPGISFDLVSSQLSLQYVWTNERQLRTFFRNVTDRLEAGGFFIGSYPDPIKLLEKLAASPDHRTITIGDIGKIKFHKTLEELQGIDPYGIVYEVTLGEVMCDVPEYLISPPIFEKLAEEYGLMPITQMNFQDFYQFYKNYKNAPPYAALLRIHDVPLKQSDIPAAEWDVLSLYTGFVFQKQFATGTRRDPAVTERDIIHL